MSINPITGQPYESLTREYAACNTQPLLTASTERNERHPVVNRQGHTIYLTSALLAEHFTWAMSQPVPSSDPQGRCPGGGREGDHSKCRNGGK